MWLTIIRICTKDTSMIVCLCNRLNDKSVRQAIQTGAQKAEDVHASCGVEVSCGGCLNHIEGMLREIETGETLGDTVAA